jgi:hypothetical protein
MKVEAPQIIYSALILLSTGIAWARWGQQKTDSYDLVDCLVAPGIAFGLLWWGGFYG